MRWTPPNRRSTYAASNGASAYGREDRGYRPVLFDVERELHTERAVERATERTKALALQPNRLERALFMRLDCVHALRGDTLSAAASIVRSMSASVWARLGNSVS